MNQKKIFNASFHLVNKVKTKVIALFMVFQSITPWSQLKAN